MAAAPIVEGIVATPLLDDEVCEWLSCWIEVSLLGCLAVAIGPLIMVVFRLFVTQG